MEDEGHALNREIPRSRRTEDGENGCGRGGAGANSRQVSGSCSRYRIVPRGVFVGVRERSGPESSAIMRRQN